MAPPRSIGGTPLGGTPIPIRPPHTKPTWPPVINPPDPVIPPGTPPGDIVPITVTPVDPNPPPPAAVIPPHGQPGVWSDGWMLFRQQGGAIVVDASTGSRSVTEVKQVFSDQRVAQSLVNQMLGLLWTSARATTIEPWPVRPASTMSKSLRGNTMPDITLADLAAQIQVLIINSEQVNSRLAAIEEHLAGAETEQPPAPPATDDDAEFWAQFLAAVDPDPETFEPEVFDFYARGRVLYQWRAEYTPTGKRIYPAVPVARKMDYIRKMWAADSAEAQPWIQAGVDRETAVYGILAGWCDEVFATGFGARPQSAILPLAGKSAADLFAKDIGGVVPGGTPGGDD